MKFKCSLTQKVTKIEVEPFRADETNSELIAFLFDFIFCGLEYGNVLTEIKYYIRPRVLMPQNL